MLREAVQSQAPQLRQPYVLPANDRKRLSTVQTTTGELVEAAMRAQMPDELLMNRFLDGDTLERPQG